MPVSIRTCSRCLLLGAVVLACVPASRAYNLEPGFSITSYATGIEPRDLAFNRAGILFSTTGKPPDPLYIYSIDTAGNIAPFGDQAIVSPVSILYDASGRFGETNSLLIGGSKGIAVLLASGRSYLKYQDQINGTPLGDIDDMKFDRTGRLLLVSSANVIAVEPNGNATILLTEPERIHAVGVDNANNIYVAVGIVIHKYDASGNLLDGSFFSDPYQVLALEFSEGGPFGHGLYALREFDLLKFSLDGSYSKFATGFLASGQGVGLIFGPDGALYGSEFNRNNTGEGDIFGDIFRIAPDQVLIPGIVATPNVLWPPNHKMIPVTVTVPQADLFNCRINSVSNNELVTAADWQITGDLTVNLRAERSGEGSGRVYTIAVQCSDTSGNSATGTTVVTVPYDQGK